MALPIANQAVVRKIETLARATGLTKTAAVERAVERMLAEHPAQADGAWQSFDAIEGVFTKNRAWFPARSPTRP